jgi:DNA-directed RNA polymerase subunit H
MSMKERKRLDALAHKLVPNHSILTKQETDALLKEYSIKLVNLPRLFTDDPIAIALGAVVEGDVVKITRKSLTIVDTVKTYRFVVKRRNE